MVRLLGRIARSFRFGRELGRAQRFAWEGKDEEAEVVLRGIFREFGAQGASALVPVDANIMFADVCLRKGELHEAYEACVIAQTQIIRPRGVSCVYNDDDKKYLMLHCKWILSLVTGYIDSIAFQGALSIETHFTDIDMKRVKPWLRLRFPMSKSQGSALDKFFFDNEVELRRN